MNRTQIINQLAEVFQLRRYLEVGVGDGEHFRHVQCPEKSGVDPGGNECSAGEVTHRMSSREFFASNTERFDLVFIDGLHHADVVERDIRDAMACLAPGGVVVCHDMNPHTEAMQLVPRQHGEWTGDCWRAWLRLRAERGDLQMFVVDTDYGVGIIYPEGRSRAERLEVVAEGVAFGDFMEHKSEWLPLVAPGDFLAELGVEMPQ